MEREFIMDPNNFSLDALLSSSEFSSVESAKTGYSYSELENFLKDNVKDDEVSSEIKGSPRTICGLPIMTLSSRVSALR